VLLQHYYVAIIFHHQVLHTFSVCTRQNKKFEHHPRPLGYLCAKFCCFCGLHWRASPLEKMAYSITHSLYHSPSVFGAME